MTFGVEASASSDTSILAGQSSLLSFFRGVRKVNTRTATTGNPSTQTECSVEQVYDSELQPELSAGSLRSNSVSSGRCVASVLQVLATSQDNLSSLTAPLASPGAPREAAGFFSSTNSITAAVGAPSAAAGRDSRSSLLSRLLKLRSSSDSKNLVLSTAGAGTGTENQASVTSKSAAQTDAVAAPEPSTAQGQPAAAEDNTTLPRSSSCSMSQMQASMERKRTRFGQQGTNVLSWSVDLASMQHLSPSSPGAPADSTQQQQQQNLWQQAHKQQQSSDSLASPSNTDLAGAECYVIAKSAADTHGHADEKAKGGKQSPRSPKASCKQQPWVSPKASPRGRSFQQAAVDFFPLPGRRSPRKSAVPTVPVHELAAAFERRCAANSPPPASSGSASQKQSPRKCKTPEGLSASSTPRLSHFNAQQHQPHNSQRHHSYGSRSSLTGKPGSPFYTIGGQKQALASWEAGSQQHQGGGSSGSGCAKPRSRVPPLVWPPKVNAAVAPPVSSSSSAPVNWEPSSSITLQTSHQLQQLASDGTATAAISAAAQDSSSSSTDCLGTNQASSTSTGSRGGSSPFKPKPPASGASPQRSRPGLVIRSASSAPQPNPQQPDNRQQQAPLAGGGGTEPDSRPGTAGGVGATAAAPAAAAQTSESAMSSSAAAAAGGKVSSASTAGGGTPRGLRGAALLMPLTRNRPQPSPSVPDMVHSPRGLTPLEVHSPRASAVTTPRGSPVLISALDAAVRLTPRAGATPRGNNSNASSSYAMTHGSMPTGLQTPLAPAAAAAVGVQQAAEMQAMQVLQLQKQQQAQVHAMQLKMQHSQPQLPLKTPSAPQQQQCMPIAIARHCPQDLQGTTWQPRDFIQTKKLYEGKIAAVVQGYHAASSRPLALKVYNRARLDTMERFQLAREVCLHMRSCHPSITALYAAYKDARYIYLLMELAPSGNLYQMLMSMPVPPGRPRCLPEREAVVRVIKPLLSALGYLHEQGIIHRDIKLENVLLTAEGDIKLADFGLSIDTRHEPANTRLGTQGYFAPEVLALPLKSSPFEGKSPEEAASRPSYDCKVDVWSAGVVCFEVLTGRAPFAAENVAQVLQAILHRQLVYPGHLSTDAVSFLSTALTRDPRVRPTVKELLQHRFITMHTATLQAQQQQQ